MTERVPPRDLEAEASLLGALMLDRNAIVRVADIVQPDDFDLDIHAQIYRAAWALFETAKPIDLVTLSDELRRMGMLERVGGPPFLAELQGVVPTAANAEHYARLVRDASVKRRLIRSGTRIVSLGYDEQKPAAEAADQAQALLFAALETQSGDGVVPLHDVVRPFWEDLQKAHEEGQRITGLPSGFLDLDAATGGFQAGNLIILAARPGQGKTSWCLNVADHLGVNQRIPVVIFSLEMSRGELLSRLLCSRAAVDASRLRTGLLTSAEWARLTPAIGQLAEAPIGLDDTPNLSVMELRTRARRAKASTGGLGLVIVDYLQLMEGRIKESREREVADISRSLKGLARELGVPIIACSQMNREAEKRTNHRPQLSDLRDSGAVEQDSDLVIFIYRDRLYTGNHFGDDVAEIIIAKHRNGPTKTIKLTFLPERTKFANYVGRDVSDRSRSNTGATADEGLASVLS